MPRPDFISPDFVGDSDPEQIQERMMGNLPADISNMEGDFPYDFTMPAAIEISQLIQFDIVRTLMIAFPEYAWDEWLDLHGAQAGLTRNSATRATGTVSVTASSGTVLATGTIFAVPGTDYNEPIEFRTVGETVFSSDGTLDIAIEAVNAGTDGNVAAGTITIMGTPVAGVTAIMNPEATSGGTEAEDDEDFYERIFAENKDANFYVGNDADFVKWSKEVSGIGDCIVDSDDLQPGVVKLILVDSNGAPASEALVTAVYNHIVSPDDRSKRLLPTGCCQLIVTAATSKAIDYTCTGLILDGTTISDVQAAFAGSILEIYSAAKADNILRYNALRTALSTISGVSDFAGFTVNGAESNIVLDAAEYPVTGTITFTLEGE